MNKLVLRIKHKRISSVIGEGLPECAVRTERKRTHVMPLSKGKVTVVSGVLEDSLVSGDGFLEGLSLFLDGLLVSRDGGSSFGEGVGSGSGGSSLGLISGIFGLDGSGMGSDGVFLFGLSGLISSGGLFSCGVFLIEHLVGFGFGFSGSLEVGFGVIESGVSSFEGSLGLVPCCEGGGSVHVSGVESSDGDLVVCDGLELSGDSSFQLLDGELVVADGFLVDLDGSIPGLVPSGTDELSGGLLVLGGEVLVGSGESGLDEFHVLSFEGFTCDLSFLEHLLPSEEGLISEGGFSGGDDGEGGDGCDLGEHGRLVILKLIIVLRKHVQVNENNPIKPEK